MAKLSKQVDNRLIVSGKVVASARTHAAEIAKVLAAKAEEAQGAAKAPPAKHFEATIEAYAATLEHSAATLRSAELTYSAEQADDVAPREKRDKLTADAFGLMVKVRSTVESTMGAAGLKTYGLEGETPRSPRAVASHMGNVVSLMEKQPATVTDELGTTFDTKAAVAVINPKRDALESVLTDVDREARELEDALGKRDRAVEAWIDAYQGVATAFSGMCRLAGRKDLAERVRPTSRTVSGEETGEEGPPQGGQQDGGTGTP
ncbi:MAG: hypothetical protein QM820_21540 [Minicystis sp.]